VTQVNAPVLTEPSQINDYFDFPLTDEQLRAATAPMEPLVIISGAGTGKTTVMQARVLWLVGSGQVRPDQVLGLTFTNKAAAVLATRIQQSLWKLQDGLAGGASDNHGLLMTEPEPTVSTYHSYAANIVSRHGLRIGIEPDARLLDQPLRFQLASNVVRYTKLPIRYLEKKVADIAGKVLSLDGQLSEHLLDPDKARAHDEDVIPRLETVLAGLEERLRAGAKVKGFAVDVRKVLATARGRLELLALVRELRDQRRKLSVIEFGDQLHLAAQIARQFDDVGTQEREQFKVVLLDEYQDTSVAQKDLILSLFGQGHSVTAVGDPMQSIYGWRGASANNIKQFPAEFAKTDGSAATELNLTINNRSGQLILDAANVVSEDLRAGAKPLVAAPHTEPNPKVQVAVFETAEQEIAWGADYIADHVERGTQCSDIAVLARSGGQVGFWYRELIKREIPVEVVGIGGLLEIPEVQDVVATLKLLNDACENPSLIRLLTGPRWRIGSPDLLALRARAESLLLGAETPKIGDRLTQALNKAVEGSDSVETLSLLEAVLSPGTQGFSAEAIERFEAFAQEFESLQTMVGQPPVELVSQIIRVSGLGVEVGVRSALGAGSDALDSFVSIADEFSALDGQVSLRAFMAYLSAAEDDANALDGAMPSASNSVKLMTIHKSKGLEFKVVVIPNVTHRYFPYTFKRRERWTVNAQALPFDLRGDKDDYPELSMLDDKKAHGEFKDAIDQLHHEEEYRLGYVAITRAESELVMTSHWWGLTQKTPYGPSEFLTKLKEVPGINAEIWCDEPKAESGKPTNPLLEREHHFLWPAPLDETEFQNRKVAAKAVLDAMTTPVQESVFASSQAQEWRRDAAALIEDAKSQYEPVREVEIPQAITASALIAISKDSSRFAADLVRPMPRKPVKAANRGTDFHTWVEARFGQRSLLDRDDLLGAADDDFVVADQQLRALQEAFSNGRFADRLPALVEAPIQTIISEQVVRGRIDAVYENPDGTWELIDWKTGAKKADPIQLAVYRLAWSKMRGLPLEKITAAFYYVTEDELQYPDVSELTEEALARILALEDD